MKRRRNLLRRFGRMKIVWMDERNLNQEAKAEKRIDAADGDFSSETPIETHGHQPRRSIRRKLSCTVPNY